MKARTALRTSSLLYHTKKFLGNEHKKPKRETIKTSSFKDLISDSQSLAKRKLQVNAYAKITPKQYAWKNYSNHAKKNSARIHNAYFFKHSLGLLLSFIGSFLA